MNYQGPFSRESVGNTNNSKTSHIENIVIKKDYLFLIKYVNVVCTKEFLYYVVWSF